MNYIELDVTLYYVLLDRLYPLCEEWARLHWWQFIKRYYLEKEMDEIIQDLKENPFYIFIHNQTNK